MPLDKKVIPGLIKDLKYMKEFVAERVAEVHGNDEVTEAEVDKVLEDFLQKEQTKVEAEMRRAAAKSSTVTQRTERQAKCEELKKKRAIPFDVKEYNKGLLRQKLATSGSVTDKLAAAKDPRLVAAAESLLTESQVNKIAETYGSGSRTSMAVQDGLANIARMDKQLGAELLATLAEEEEAPKRKGSVFGRMVDAVSSAASSVQNRMYNGLIYKIAAWEVKAGIDVSAIKPGSQWRKDIEVLKVSEKFKKDMAKVTEMLGDDGSEVAKSKNVIMQLNLALGQKTTEKQDTAWFIQVSLAAIAKGLSEGVSKMMRRGTDEDASPAVKVREIREIGVPTLDGKGVTSDSLKEKYGASLVNLGAMPEHVKQQGGKTLASHAMMANIAEQVSKQRYGSDTHQLETGGKKPIVSGKALQEASSDGQKTTKQAPQLPPRPKTKTPGMKPRSNSDDV